MRDITLADTVYICFSTRSFSTGAPTQLAGTPVVSAYENDSLTQITAGITLGVDHDSVTGLNLLTIVATGANGYEDDKDYNLVITTGTVGGVSVVGEVVGQFSIQRSPVNWANVSNPTTAVDLSGTDIQLVDTATTVTGGATSAAQTTAQNDLDIITGSDGTTLATTQGNYAPAKAGDNMGTVSSVTGNVDGSVASVTAINTTGGAIDNVTLVATTTTNTDMRGTDGANTTVPDAAGVAPTAVENRQEMDSNSVQLNTTLPTQIDSLGVKKNTAFSNYEFLVVLTSDHVTPATGLTVTGQRSINGGAFASVSGAIAEVSNGIYQFDALAADTNGDVITWRFSAGTADDVFETFKTIS